MEEKKNNPLAIASLVLSLVGLLVAGLPCGMAAAVTGIVGIARFDSEKEKGKGMAIAGLVIGIIDIFMVFLWIIIKSYMKLY